ncbi:hypothetical protein JYU34_011952 [Plutella xylostella]|uniref:Glucose-methanol-choline oxidoreductase N-terminal domain-containing protein n=1 Tax=Plutella xylostella TaxID=51655 RepID=A0ABQ7QDZ5_PLUXY|nr:hypothetical protein JYU34_011952 [Plutella xylostella]
MWACDAGLTSTIVESYAGAGPLFVNTLQTFLAAHCALVGDHLWPADAKEEVLRDPYYDFIVVGAGSGGAVVANRLSEVPEWRVLLVEAGGNPTLGTESPQIFYANLKTKLNWDYKTEPQPGACGAYKTKGCSWPRGKVLGGSSSINAMFYVRGNKEDYNEWAAAGNTGWSYNDVLPYFKKSENFYKPLTPETAEHHGSGGYLHVEHTEDVADIENLLLQANAELGLEITDDINGARQLGVTRALTTTKDGVRQSTARAFLSPIRDRPNFHVLKDALATKILFKPNTNEVAGILVNKDGKDIEIYARKEVIVSAGAINTPQLLMLSGIGPKQHLEKIGIEVKSDLPVGENLQDHPFVAMMFTTKSDSDLASLPNIVGGVSQYLLHQKGPLADLSPHRIVGFTNTLDPKATFPDVQTHYVVMVPNLTNIVDYFAIHDSSQEVQEQFQEIIKDNFVLIPYSVLLKPNSKGRILLKTKDPRDKPLIYANYFDDPEDLKTIIRGMRFIAKFRDTKSFQSIGLKLRWFELEACKGLDEESDEFYECMARQMTFSLYHPTSTAKMGPESDSLAVVDPELRVRGVRGLRVMDASVMPSIVRGNTNAPVIMIAERGADLVKKHWGKLERVNHSEL